MSSFLRKAWRMASPWTRLSWLLSTSSASGLLTHDTPHSQMMPGRLGSACITHWAFLRPPSVFPHTPYLSGGSWSGGLFPQAFKHLLSDLLVATHISLWPRWVPDSLPSLSIRAHVKDTTSPRFAALLCVHMCVHMYGEIMGVQVFIHECTPGGQKLFKVSSPLYFLR